MTLSGKYWPVHPKPFPDEIFSSWLIRTAAGNSPKLHSFCHKVWPERQIWTRDIDRLFAPDLITKMSDKTATPRAGLERHFLQRYEGLLFERMVPNALNPWIRHIGVHHRLRLRHGHMYCPLCLESDETPYMRMVWRTNLSPVCLIHGVVLRDECDRCDSPVMPHRGLFMECGKCSYDMRDAKAWASKPGALLLGRALVARSNGERVWGVGVPDIENDIEFFQTVRAIMLLLIIGQRSHFLRLSISKITKTPPKIRPGAAADRLFENLRSNELHEIFDLTSVLLRGWPWMMIGLCSDARIWKSWALAGRTRKDFPAYTKIVLEFLEGPLSYK